MPLKTCKLVFGGALLLDRFWRMLASIQGNLLKAENLGGSLDISRAAVMRLIDFQEGAFILRGLKPWFANIRKRLVKSPKVDIGGSGLLPSLQGLAAGCDLLLDAMEK